MATRYVDPDAAVGGDGTTNGLSGSTCAYRSLSIAEAALPATLAEPWEIVCCSSHANHTADATSAVFTGVTTSSTNNLHVYSHVDSRPPGKWDATKYRLDVGSARAISNGLANITFTAIQAKTREIGFYHCFYTQTATTKFIGCIAGGSWSGGTGFFLEVNGAECWNCIAYGCYQGFNGGGTLTKFYNCTSVANRQNGFYRAGGTPVCTNCYAGDNVVGQYTANLTLTTCGSSDTSGSTGLQNIAVSTSTGAKFTNVTAGSEDFHLQSGSALIDVGTSLSATFTTDIDGETRSGTWDVGADEYVASGGTTYNESLTLSAAGTLGQSAQGVFGASMSFGAQGGMSPGGAGTLAGALQVDAVPGMSSAARLDILATLILAAAQGMTASGLGSLAGAASVGVSAGLTTSSLGQLVASLNASITAAIAASTVNAFDESLSFTAGPSVSLQSTAALASAILLNAQTGVSSQATANLAAAIAPGIIASLAAGYGSMFAESLSFGSSASTAAIAERILNGTLTLGAVFGISGSALLTAASSVGFAQQLANALTATLTASESLALLGSLGISISDLTAALVQAALIQVSTSAPAVTLSTSETGITVATLSASISTTTEPIQ